MEKNQVNKLLTKFKQQIPSRIRRFLTKDLSKWEKTSNFKLKIINQLDIFKCHIMSLAVNIRAMRMNFRDLLLVLLMERLLSLTWYWELKNISLRNILLLSQLWHSMKTNAWFLDLSMDVSIFQILTVLKRRALNWGSQSVKICRIGEYQLQELLLHLTMVLVWLLILKVTADFMI